MDESEGFKLESELKGTTFKVYWYLLKAGQPVGVRETQRALGLSSPSVALHHLEKLRRLKLLAKDAYGRYSVKEDVKVGALRSFLKFGRFMLPRYLFYAVFFSSATALYLIQAFLASEMPGFMALTLGFGASVIFWYETIKVWKEKLF